MREDRARKEAFVARYKLASGCADCPPGTVWHVSQLDLDHVRGKKVADISTLVRSASLARIEEELTKCEVVCANCHRLRTWQRAQAAALLKVLDSTQARAVESPADV